MIIKRWNGSFTATRTFTFTNGFSDATGGDTTGLSPTMNITGVGIPAGTKIVSITSGTALNTSAN
jgi:hypothetical protein